MPTRTRPTTPRIHPTIRRSYEGTACPCEGRETSALLPPNPPPSPSPQAKAAGRRAGGPNQRRNADPSLPLAAVLPALPPLGAGLALPACPKDDHRTVRSHFNGPIPRRSPAAARCGCRACPGEGRGLALRLVSLCRFRAILHRGPRPPFGSRLGRYDLSPLVDVPTPPSGAVRPPTGQCLAATVRLPLSTCPGPLKPKLHRVPSGTGWPEKTRRTIQSNSNRRPRRAGEGRGERQFAVPEGSPEGNPSGKGFGGCAPNYPKDVRGREGGPNQRRYPAPLPS